MTNPYEFTVFTPTYNRAYIIEKLYESLKRQTFRDFEWLVVDDGSSDNTQALFDRIRQEAPFPVQYIRVENGGKHRAINVGVNHAQGRLFFIVDSDDYLVDDALERIITAERSIPRNTGVKYSGIRALRCYPDGNIIGTKFSGGDFADLTQLEEAKLVVAGDKCEAFYTEVMKLFPFPEFEGEKFLGESVVWDKIAAHGYKNRCINEAVYVCEYLGDGLTAGSKTHHKKNPKGMGLYIYQSIQYKKLIGWDKRYTVRNYYDLHKDDLDLQEIANNLHMTAAYLAVYLRWIQVRIFFRRKWRGLKRRLAGK